MKNNLLKSICWDITSKCNETCRFCYRNSKNLDLLLNDNKIILKKLIDFGVDKISFVGGEPLLYENLFDLVKWGKDYCKGKTVFSITTNAILLTDIVDNSILINEKMMQKVTDVFDWITFSLDAPNSQLQSNIGRNKYHFERIKSLLIFAKKKRLSNKIKINTVVCKDNINSLIELFYLLENYNVSRWKLFRFLPSRGSAAIHKDEYKINDDEFENAISKLFELNVNHSIKISKNGYDKFDNSYITISSEGKLVIYNGEKYINKVDLRTDDVSKILKFININKHLENRADFSKL